MLLRCHTELNIQHLQQVQTGSACEFLSKSEIDDEDRQILKKASTRLLLDEEETGKNESAFDEEGVHLPSFPDLETNCQRDLNFLKTAGEMLHETS